MTLAVRWGSIETPEKPAGFVYFDAVSLFTRDYKGKVTKHPVASGNPISDHFIKENDEISISGIISGTDISTFSMIIKDLEGNIPYNAYDNALAVSINSVESGLFKLLPDVIGQFFEPVTPEVTINADRTDVTDQVEKALINLMSGVVFNEKSQRFDSNIQLVELYEYKKTIISNITNNLVITSLKFREDARTGQSLYFDMKLERVTFAFLKKGKLPKDVIAKLRGATTPKQKKGPQDSTSKDVVPATTGATGRTDSPLKTTPQPGFGLGQPLA